MGAAQTDAAKGVCLAARLTAVALLAAIAPAAAHGSAVAELLQPRLTAAAGEARLELPSGEAVALALPPGARLETAAALAGGWLAAGTTPGAASAASGAGGRELLLLAGAAATGARAAALPAPGGRTGKLRAEPLPLVADGRLAGMAWLEGDDPQALGVRYAAWTGGGWSAPRTISAQGQGSQLALTAARLAGGSWLLAWSAFDGHDDEIVWSVGANGAWTPPRRLTDNQVPDMTPALAAAGGGAVIAWSQLAGDGYRLLLARFQDGRWSEPAAVGPGGWLYPAFAASPRADRLRLVVRTARPRGWAALELDTAGRPLRLAEIADDAAPAAGDAADAAGSALARPGLALAGTPGRAAFTWHAGGGERTAPWRPWLPPAPAAALPAGRAAEPGAAAVGDASNQVYIAFGDSITSGFGDPKGIGYPGRLESLLTAAAGTQVTVINQGLFGETTAEGLSRIDQVLQPGATALLLMEGTNDISARVPVSTIVQNLELMARKAEALGIPTVHATVIPRLPTADTDADNVFTASLAAGIRELAWEKRRSLADPFEVFFFLTPNALSMDYLGGGDKLHPNSAGYDLVAQTFFDVLTGVDAVPPVPGKVSPSNGRQGIPANTMIALDLYDFGAGIDIANTKLLIGGQPVVTTPTGDQSKLQFHYQPPTPLAGVVSIGIQAQDLAKPPNTFTGALSTFEVAGTSFLPGDINRDGIVDGKDLILLAYCFGAHRLDSNYMPDCDLNGDGVVDGLDLAILAAKFGKRSF